MSVMQLSFGFSSVREFFSSDSVADSGPEDVAYNAFLLKTVLLSADVLEDVCNDVHEKIGEYLQASKVKRLDEPSFYCILSRADIDADVISEAFVELKNDPPNMPFGMIPAN